MAQITQDEILSDNPDQADHHSILETEVPPSFNFLSLIIERYGPFAFGVILLLTVWQMVAQPQIEASRIDFEQQQKLVTELGQIMNAFKVCGEQQRATAEVLKTTTELLSKTSEKLSQIIQK